MCNMPRINAATKAKSAHLLPKMSASGILQNRVPRNATHLFGNPAVLTSGPVALRHQIALVLPLSEICYLQRFILAKRVCGILCTKIFRMKNFNHKPVLIQGFANISAKRSAGGVASELTEVVNGLSHLAKLQVPPACSPLARASVLAAMMKSLVCSPPMMCVHHETVTLPHSVKIAGWWFSRSAISPTRLVNCKAWVKFLKG